jgi:iron complex transport system substrate-binding protein
MISWSDAPTSVITAQRATPPRLHSSQTRPCSRQSPDRSASWSPGALSFYHIDTATLKGLRPDVILTQAQCDVCAVTMKDVEAALGSGSGRGALFLWLQRRWLMCGDIGSVAAVLNVPAWNRLGERWRERVRRSRPRLAARLFLPAHRMDDRAAAGNWVRTRRNGGGLICLANQANTRPG